MSYSAISTHYNYNIPINSPSGRHYMQATLQPQSPTDSRGADSPPPHQSSRKDRREHRHKHSHSASSSHPHRERRDRERSSNSSSSTISSKKSPKLRKRSATDSQISLPKFHLIPPTPPVQNPPASGYIASGNYTTASTSLKEKLDRRSTHPRYTQQQPITDNKQSTTAPYPTTPSSKPRTIADFIRYSRHPFSQSKTKLSPQQETPMENVDLNYYIPATTEEDLVYIPEPVEIDGKSIDHIPNPKSPKRVGFADEPLPPLNTTKYPVSPQIGSPVENGSPKDVSPSPPHSPYIAYNPHRNSLTPSPSPISQSPPTSASTERVQRQRQSISRRQTENPYQHLQQFDYIFIIDDSASMFGHNWQQVLEALKTLTATAFEYTRGYSAGFDIVFLNSWRYNAVKVKTVEEIVSIFKQVVPHGVTPTASVLDGVLRGYLDKFYEIKEQLLVEGRPARGGQAWSEGNIKPMNIVILTDGEPTDEPEDVIVAMARELDRLNAPLNQVGIQFVQIGDDEAVTEYLEALDDALSKEYNIRDIVDTTPYTGKDLTGDELLKILLGAVNKRLDRMKNQRRGQKSEVKPRAEVFIEYT